jgi:REP-associated tyrosine transposase
VEERNYDLFLKLFEKHLSPVVDLFAYCMLRNHFHVSVRTKTEQEILKTLRVSHADMHHNGRESLTNQLAKQSSKPLGSTKSDEDSQSKPLGLDSLGSNYISNQFSNFLNAYAKTINKTYERTGSLFQHPFGRVPITSDKQFWNVIAYIHQNPKAWICE